MGSPLERGFSLQRRGSARPIGGSPDAQGGTMADHRPPNILFFYNDDQRADTIRALGNTHITTPNLDRMVENGRAFRRAYCMGAMQGAVCVPSRAMMLTGRTLFRAHTDLEGQTTWPELFGRAGYTTFITGKWHNQAPGLLRSFQ